MAVQAKWKIILTAAAFALSPITPVLAAQGFFTTADATWQESCLVYPYFDGSIYQVKTQLGQLTDIELRPGETVQKVLAGETKRWGIETAMVGRTPHVYVKPKADGISTNFIINTNQRSYRLQLVTAAEYSPIVRWQYALDIQKNQNRQSHEEAIAQQSYNEIFMQRYQGRLVPKVMNYAYKVEGSKKAGRELYPVKIFDDGTRTYIEMPRSNQYDLPVLYNVDDSEKKGKLMLVNYRIRHGYFIADRVFKHARLHFSNKIYVDIYPAKVPMGGEKT